MTPDEAKQLYLAAQEVQRRVSALDVSSRQLVMLTAQAAGLRGRSTTTPAMVRKKTLEILTELDEAKRRAYTLLDTCTTLETPFDSR